MTPEPPDRPTERLPPRQPAARVEEHTVVPDVDPHALYRLEDAIGSLRTGVMIVGVIAVAALGAALYGLLRDDGSAASGGSASADRIAQLDDRVDRLSRQVQDARSSASDAAGLEDRVSSIEETVKELADRPAADPQEAIDELSGRIDAVAKDVEQLKQAAPAP